MSSFLSLSTRESRTRSQSSTLPWTPPPLPTFIHIQEQIYKVHTKPRLGISEYNPNRFHFLVRDEQDQTGSPKNSEYISPQTMRHIMFLPHRVGKWKDMQTINSDGVLIPAHLPSLQGLRTMPPVLQLLFLWGLKELEVNNAREVIPEFLAPILDPPVDENGTFW